MKKGSNCKSCGKLLFGKQSLYCSVQCKNSFHQSYASQKRRGLKRKLYYVNFLGGKCSNCGYDKNLAGLAFHHINNKEFQLDVRSLSNRKTSKIETEIKKCLLLCHNCHAETHNPTLDLKTLELS